MNQVSPLIPPELAARVMRPTVRLHGPVCDEMVSSFLTQVTPVLDLEGAIVVELYTSGGDADVAQRIAEDVRLVREQHGRDLWLLGKTLVASAGTVIMGAFPRERRWMTQDATLLIHGRRMEREVRLEGPLGGCRRRLEEFIAEIDNGLRREDEGYARLVEGSAVTLENVRERAYSGWYLTAEQALEAGLIAGVV